MKVGRRLAMKVLNVSKFVLGSVGATRVGRRRWSPSRSTGRCSASSPAPWRGDHARFDGLRLHDRARGDRAVLLGLLRRLRRAGQGAGVRRRRRRRDRPPSRRAAALATALHVQLRLFAPFLPYATEEVWSWWQPGSVHLQAWPDRRTSSATRPQPTPRCSRPSPRCSPGVRGAKSTAKVGMRTPVERATITGPAERARGDPRAPSATCARSARSPVSSTWSRPRTARSVVEAVLGEPPPKR